MYNVQQQEGSQSLISKSQAILNKCQDCLVGKQANEDAEARTWKKKELELRQKQKENQAVIDALPPPMIGKDDIAQIVSAWTGIPVTEAVQSERETLLNLSKTLKVGLMLAAATFPSRDTTVNQLLNLKIVEPMENRL